MLPSSKSLNILLGADYHAKICDFGLSRIKLESSTFNIMKCTIGTVRWTAPEILNYTAPPSQASDIYSFGIVLWEIASREIPYKDASYDLVPIWIKDGKKETIPADCPEGYGKIIQETWKEAKERPTAAKIVIDLTDARPTPDQTISLILTD